MLAENVIKLNEDALYEDIIAYFNELEVRSKNTRIAYESAIRQFFKVMKDKEIEHLTNEDLEIKKKDVLNYRKYLMENFDLANGTINNKITPVKELYLYLSDEYDVNMKAFNFKSLKVQDNPYGSLSQTEAERFAETAFRIEKTKNLCKKLLILTAIRTSFRLSELLNLKWSDFEEIENGYKVKTIGKGQKKNTTAITKNLYNQLCELKEINKCYKWNFSPEYVFQISKDAVNDMMQRLKKELDIDENRNITFHSFKGVAIDFAYENGDIKAAALQGNHSNINTTFKHYIDKSRDYSQVAGILMEEELDLSFVDELTIEDFREFIKNGSHKVQLEIKEFMEIKNKNN